MANRSKRIGDAYERFIEKLCRDAGFPDSKRTRPGRREDEGDLYLTSDIVVQIKDVVTPKYREWMEQLADQKRRAGVRFAFIAMKRRGRGSLPPLHLAVLPLDQMLDLIKELELLRKSS